MSIFKSLRHKPWERKGVIGGLEAEGTFAAPSEKVALILFLLIATIIFSLLIVNFFARMQLPDWQPLSEPAQLWINTALLLISSVLFQWARTTTKHDGHRNVITAFTAGGIFAILFIVGQIMTWGSLQQAGYYLTSSPASSFFYLITGVHALHLLGGLWFWSKSTIKLFSGVAANELKLSIELCTFYWHFLFLAWLLMFAVLANN